MNFITPKAKNTGPRLRFRSPFCEFTIIIHNVKSVFMDILHNSMGLFCYPTMNCNY